jgi:hypothetical protein
VAQTVATNVERGMCRSIRAKCRRTNSRGERLVIAENDIESGEGLKPTLRQSSFTLTTLIRLRRFRGLFGPDCAIKLRPAARGNL